MLLEVLAPIAEAELVYRKAAAAWQHRAWSEWDDEPGFPELDGPVFLLGEGALMDAIWGLASSESPQPSMPALYDEFVPSQLRHARDQAIHSTQYSNRMLP